MSKARNSSEFLARLKMGETFYMTIIGKKKGFKSQSMTLGHDSDYADLMSAVAGFACRHDYKKIRVSFSRNVMTDAEAVVTLSVNQKVSLIQERTC